jgi:hypothetical protein
MSDCLTFHYDAGRLGQGAGASAGTMWGKRTVVNLGAAVRGAALFLGNSTFPYGPRAGQTHDVVIVVTSDNHVFAFAVDDLGAGNTPIWSRLLGPPVTRAGSNIPPPIGVCSTPVLDPANQRMFVMSYQDASGTGIYLAVALDINTGQVIQSAKLTDFGATGRPTFDGNTVDQRGALNLVNGRIISTYADFLGFDAGPYHGWVASCNANNLNDQSYLSVTKNVLGGGCWGPGGAAAAADGSLFIGTGNATTADNNYWSGLPAGKHPGDLGDFFEAVVKVGAAGRELQVIDWYQPTSARLQNDRDQDFGSSSPIVLPPIAGRQLVAIAAKFGIYLLDGNKLGHWGGELWKAEGDINTGTAFFPQESHSAPAHYLTPAGDHLVYFVGGGLPGLIAYKVVVAASGVSLQEVWRANHTGLAIGNTHGSPTVGAVAAPPFALVWIVDSGESASHGVLRAFNALDGTQIYTSSAVAGDDLGDVPHYAPITCTSAGVFVGTATGIAWYAPVDPCKAQLDHLTDLQNELENLQDALASGETPIPRTPQNVARVEAAIAKLRGEVRTAEQALATCRAAHPGG